MPWTKGTEKTKYDYDSSPCTQAHWPLIFQQSFHSHNNYPRSSPILIFTRFSPLQKSKLLQKIFLKCPLPRDSCPKLAHVRPGWVSRNNARAGLRLNLREGHLEGWWWKTMPTKNRFVKPHKEKQWRAVCRAGCFHPPTSMMYFCTALLTQHLFFSSQ